MRFWALAALVVAAAVSGCKATSVSTLGVLAPDASADSGCAANKGTGDKSNGQACGCAGECASGFCVEGLCCNSLCDGTCQSCTLATSLGKCAPTPAGVKPRPADQCPAALPATCALDGTCDGAGKCRQYPTGTVCTAGTCDGDSIVGNNVCDGVGHCRPGATTVCAPFSCDTKTNKCFPTCASDTNCVSGRKCVSASCGPKMIGTSCPTGKDSECATNHCVDGVCCNSSCGGACRSCNLLGLEGICSPVPAGLGHPLCTTEAPSTCGTTGVCDGFGTCAQYPANSPCGPSSCSGVTR